MKVKIGQFTREGFVSDYALVFENGLVLRTLDKRVLWGSNEEKEKIKANINEVVEILKNHGFEVEEEIKC